MLWHFLRYCVTVVFPVFYKRIQGKNIQHLQVKGPVVIAMNHPNAFTDPVAITFVTYPTRLKYLARGDAFKPGLVTFLLESLGIVPIFRIQDGGKEGLKKNDEAYRRVNELLKRNCKIIVFAEGLCVQERRLRPLKKGVARMVFGAHEFLGHDELTVVPVGVNYSMPDQVGSTIFYNVGEPIAMKDLAVDFKENEARAYHKFLSILEPRMKELIVHVNNSEYDEADLHMDELLMRSMRKEKGYSADNLEHDHLMRMEIAEKLNRAEEKDKKLTDEFAQKAKEYFKKLRAAGLRDWIIDPINRKKVDRTHLLLRSVLILVLLPVHLIGLAGNIIPYQAVKYLVTKVLRAKKEFYSSLSLGIGIFVLLIYYSLLFFAIYAFSPNVLCPILSCLIILLSGILAQYFRFYIKKTLGLRRALADPALFKEFSERREELISLINRF